MTKQFTKEQHKLLESLITDADLLGLSDKEGISYIHQKIGKQISQSTYSRCKRKIFSDNEIKSYYKNYAKIGLLKFHKERLDEMQMIHQNTLKMWYSEINKKEEEQDKKLILEFTKVLRENSQYLGNLAISLPPMAEINNTLDEQQETIRQLNEKIEYTYRKHIGFIMKKEMEFNLNKLKKEDYNNKINLKFGEKTSIDKEEDDKNEYNNNPTLEWNSITKEFIEECIEAEISDDKDNNNNSNADSIKLSKELREDLKKHKEVYERIKEAQREAVFEDL